MKENVVSEGLTLRRAARKLSLDRSVSLRRIFATSPPCAHTLMCTSFLHQQLFANDALVRVAKAPSVPVLWTDLDLRVIQLFTLQ